MPTGAAGPCSGKPLGTAVSSAPARSAARSGSAVRVLQGAVGGGAPTQVWAASAAENTRGIAWGDVDGDGDLDLAVANLGGANRVYVNQAPASPAFVQGWSSPENDDSYAVAFADVDGDGDVDLAFANGGNQRDPLFSGDGSGGFALTSSAPDAEDTRALPWGDWDGDGDPDLAVANGLSSGNHVYSGPLTSGQEPWTSPDMATTVSVAWVDGDRDGDLDLVALDSSPLQLRQYTNHRRTVAHRWPDDPVSAWVVDAGGAPYAEGYGSVAVVTTSPIQLQVALHDTEHGDVAQGRLEWGRRGSSEWTPITGGSLDGRAAASPAVVVAVPWDYLADGAIGDDVQVRAVVQRQVPRFVSRSVAWGSFASAPSAALRLYDCFPVDGDGDGSGCAADCDDGDPNRSPDLLEACDGVDNDCDGLLPTDERDADSDGWTECAGDCADDDGGRWPGATELCGDGLDQDCDGVDVPCGDDDDAGDDDAGDDDPGDDDSARGPVTSPGLLLSCSHGDSGVGLLALLLLGARRRR